MSYPTPPPAPLPAATAKKSKGKMYAVIGGIVVALILGYAAGSGGKSTGAASATATTTTVTASAPAPAPQTVTEQGASVVPATVTETVTNPAPAPVTAAAPPAATADPAGPKADGKFLLGSQIASGTWQCSDPGSLVYWSVNAQNNDIIDNGLDSIAIVPDSGYVLTLNGCNSNWNKVG